MTGWGPTHSSDYPRLMAAVVVVCATGAGSAIWPAVEHVIDAAVIGVPLVAGVVWVVRREARIRRRLADSAGYPVSGSDRRVGPGEQPPAPPAPSTSTSELPRAAVPVGHAIDTTGAPS